MSRLTQPAPKALTFDVLAEIAAGTTARIELCRVRDPKTKTGDLVAVKRLHKHIAQDPQFADMFFDEVWMTAALHHQNVVDVVGWGNDREGTYLAVELVQGVSLARLMKTVFETGEMFSERMVVFLGCSICSGLAAAHQLRGQDGEHLTLVHRDLTPGNVLISFNGNIKITDFGLAKAKQRVTKTLTGLLKGHPQYMAPEMVRGFEIDSRADLFSLGVVLFELFGGQHPWSGGTELEIMRVTATDPPKQLLAIRPKLDKELASIVHRLLEKDPADRFQHADEVRQRLLTWLDAHGYADGNEEALGRFVRRNAMRQMRWFERAVAGELSPSAIPAESMRLKARALSRDKSKSTPSPRVRRNRKGGDEGPDSYVDPSPPSEENLDTDLTDVSSRAGILSLADTRPERDPRPRRASLPLNQSTTDADHPQGIDWGEEIPTVVQRKDPTSKASDLPKFPIHDDDSDNRTTTVQSKVPDRRGGPSMMDLDSDEVATVPTAGKDALADALAAIPQRTRELPQRSGSAAKSVARSTKSLPPPPPPVKLGAAQQRTSQRPIPALPPPPEQQARADQARPATQSHRPPDRNGLRQLETSAQSAASYSKPSVSPVGNSVPPQGLRGPANISGNGALTTNSGSASLLAEADRMAVDAVRLREEADLAARVLAHKSRLAAMSNEAASLAAEAVRAAAQGAIPRASGLMDEARRLENNVRHDADIADEDLPEVPREAVQAFTSRQPGAGQSSAALAPAPSPQPVRRGPTFAGAAADMSPDDGPITPPPIPLGHEGLEWALPQSLPAQPMAPLPMQTPMQTPPNRASVPPQPAPSFGPAPYQNGPVGPEYQSNSRMRPTVVPDPASPWEAFYKREVMGFPAPVAFVLAAVLLSSVIAAIAMLAR